MRGHIQLAVIFDLDQTLIDTKALKSYRDQGNWKEIGQHLGETRLYPDIKLMVSMLHDKGIPLAIVTNSPRAYSFSLINYHDLPIEDIVAYHDTKRHKPYPDPIIKAVQLMKCSFEIVISLGDDPKDILASKSAGVISCAALWDCDDLLALMTTAPAYSFATQKDFLNFVLNFHCLL